MAHIVASSGARMTHVADPFRTLYDANQGRVERLLTRLVGPQDAEDLTQTVFAKAAKGLPTFRGDAETSTWLYRIAANVASDWLRSRPRHEAELTVPLSDVSGDDMRATTIGSADVDSRPSPEQQLSQKDMHDCIRREMGKLPDAHRDVLMLSALGGLGDDEIAATLGISKGRNSGKSSRHAATSTATNCHASPVRPIAARTATAAAAAQRGTPCNFAASFSV
jgi:RNA polymerase sigma-70 factor (ECF subfamily)